jgi:N-acetylneuraminic acid mutarotase
MNQRYIYAWAWLLTLLLVNGSLQAAAQDTWTQKADFGGRARQAAAGFSIGSKGYLGTGFDDGFTKDFWEYDPAANTWTQKADFGGSGRYGAVGFSIGNKGYLGTGAESTNSFANDFWEYDPAANAWTRKADFGGSARYLAVGFSIGNKGYLGTGGNNTTIFTKDFWEYDPTADTWTRKTDFSGSARYGAVGLSVGNKGYLGTGVGDNNGFTKDFWEYDPAANVWTRKTDFGGSARYGATGFGIGSAGYLGTGYDGVSNTGGLTGGATRDFWEYDPAANAWARKADFGGSARYLAVGFSSGSQGYLGTGFDTDSFDEARNFWQYTPVRLCQAPTDVAVASITTATASISFDGSSTAAGGYTVSYTPSGGTTAQTVPGSASPVVLTGLTPNTTYTVTVTSNCAGTQTATSTSVRFTTLCGVPMLTAPASQTVAARAGQCGASVAFTASATGTPAPTITYTLPGGQVITSPYVFPVGTTTVRATASSCGGTDSKTFTVTVTGATLAITVTSINTTYTGGIATTLYLGYGPQSVTLTASGGTSYQWSPATGLSNATIANPVFTATKAGTFTYTVSATSACTATKSVTLTVVDARCGNKLDKVVVCHSGNTLCIGADGVAAHLKHGDLLGTCSGKAQTSMAATTVAPAGASEASNSFEAYPNPFTSSTTLRFRAAQAGPVQLQVYNVLGQLVTTLYDGQVQAGQVVERTLDGTGLSIGLYTCRFATPNGEHLTQRVILTK